MEFDKMKLIGMTVEEAKSYCKEHDRLVRVVISDGMPQFVTQDVRPERFSLVVNNGKVTMFKMG